MTHSLASVTRLVPHSRDTLDAVPIAQVQGTLALDLRSASSLPVTPEYDEATRSRLEATTDAEVKTWAALFAQAVVESIGGDRPVTQLVRWTNQTVYRDLERRVQLIRLARPAGRTRVIRPQVKSVHVFQPRPGCAEVSVHVRHGDRSRCLAARLEFRSDRWVCTALELG
jgi:hypothetical protein